MKPWISLIAVDPVVTGEWTAGQRLLALVSRAAISSAANCCMSLTIFAFHFLQSLDGINTGGQFGILAGQFGILAGRVSRIDRRVSRIHRQVSRIDRLRSGRIRHTVSRSATCVSPCIIQRIYVWFRAQCQNVTKGFQCFVVSSSPRGLSTLGD